MARCEDFPCCGHEAGCCPDYSPSGQQLNMRCTCGEVVPIGSRSSLCQTCLEDSYDFMISSEAFDAAYPEEDAEEIDDLERGEIEDYTDGDY
jgi:hypothetical protein